MARRQQVGCSSLWAALAILVCIQATVCNALLRLNCTIVIMDRKRHRRHRIIEQYHLMNSSPPPPLHSHHFHLRHPSSSLSSCPKQSTMPKHLISSILHIPTLWSVLAMTSIVTNLTFWEKAIENIRLNTPKPLSCPSLIPYVGRSGWIGLYWIVPQYSSDGRSNWSSCGGYVGRISGGR